MSITRNSFRRPAALFAAAAVLVGAAIPAFLATTVDAADLASRSIQMSDSAPSGGDITSGVGSGTAVKYTVKFTTSAAMQSFLIDFCSNTPLIGDATCTAPTSFTVSSASLTAAAGWTASFPAATQIRMTNSSSQAAGSFTFEFNDITNPSVAGSLYARITTYAADNWTGYTNYANVGTTVDTGGVAMAITAPIKVTARVMETMSLCTSRADLTALACSGADDPAITLGTADTQNVLKDDLVYTNNIYSQVSTNASNGYAIYLRAHNTCGGGLSKDGGTTCGIPAVNAGAATGIAITPGTAAFGVDIDNGTAVSGGTGTNTAVSRWNPATGSYIMDGTTASDNVTYTYGSKVIESTGQANSVKNTYVFGATASPTTPAGIYTQSFSLIAVGTF